MSDEGPPQSPTGETQPHDGQERPTSAQSRKKSPKPRVPSALTVENLRKHEEEMDVVDVVELMIKNTEESVKSAKSLLNSENTHEDMPSPPRDVKLANFADSLDPAVKDTKEPEKNETADGNIERENLVTLDGDIWHQKKNATLEPIATREEVTGFKLTGEEYKAISIDVQTDESFLAEYFEYRPQEKIISENLYTRQNLGIAAADGASYTSEKRQRKHITSDISSADIADDESVLHISKSGESDNHKTDHSTAIESDAEDGNVVTEIPESESELMTHISNGSLPSVGPPTILQYKAESDTPLFANEARDSSVTASIIWEDLSAEKKEYYSNLMEEMKKMREERADSEIDANLINIGPGSSHGSRSNERSEKAKEREKEKVRARESKSQMKQTAGSAVGASGQMMANQTNFYTFARQLKTVNYSLSSEKCMEEGWTIRPSTPEPPGEPPAEVFVYDPTKDIISGKRFHQTFVQKFHPNGSPFLTIFPDGTGNVWYQSGNIAISIIATEKVGKMTFIAHDDLPPEDCCDIQGVFEPSGHCTCYFPSGGIRMLLTHIGGEYFNVDGDRVKKWQWRDQVAHVHAPPFQPITFSLTKKIGVRVLSQELIHITFTDGSRSVRFNAGTRLRFKPAAFLPKIQQLDPDLVILHEKRLHIQSIVEKLNNNLRFPNSPRLKKLKLPGYLVSELERSMKIRQQLPLQDHDTQKLPDKKEKYRKSASSRISSEISFIPKRRLRRLPFYPKVPEATEFEEIKPVVTVN